MKDKFLFCVLFIHGLSFAIVLCNNDGKPLPRFQVNLDLPAEDRWSVIGKQYSQYAPEIRAGVIDFIPEKWRSLVLKISQSLEKYLPAPYAKEIAGFARAVNITVSEAFLANLRYELTAYCTSIVVQDKKGNIFHGRNLDYDMADILRKLAIEVDFVKGGKVLYTGTTFVGFIGLFTGRRYGAFSVSVDERDTGELWWNLVLALTGTGKLLSFVLRDMLETTTSFQDAISQIKKTDFAATSYIIISGVDPGEGAVITKGRLTTIDIWMINATKSGWFLVETNYDHWTTPPTSDDRRDAAIHTLEKFGQDGISPMSLYKTLSVFPVLNEGTTYTTIMSAKDPNLYASFLRNYTTL